MYKANIYLIQLSMKYIMLNMLIVSILIFFLNFIDISRILQNTDNHIYDYIYLSILKFPSILNEILPFVTIVGISFLIRNLINNNELISLRNIGYSMFDIFLPIGLGVFFIGLFFLLFMNPLSVSFENKFQKLINKSEKSPYSIKISNNEMWIKNIINKDTTSFIKIKNIDLKDMVVENVQILLLKDNKNILILANDGFFNDNDFNLSNVKMYDLESDEFSELSEYKFQINFNKENILNSITNYKLIPFYEFIQHTNTLKKFNLYSSEIGFFYLSEVLKPFFLVMLSFIIIGFSGKLKRNENFFKILFISILIGFMIFLLKEAVTKITISFSINFIVSYLIVFLLPLSIGLYQIIKIEND